MTARKSLPRRIRRWMHCLPGMISCEEFESFILDYLEDELAAPKRGVFERHLKMCRECRDYLTAYRASIDLAKLAERNQESNIDLSDVPADLVAAVLDAQKARDG